ncbi:DUF417 family protein [Chryseobacterium sp. SG20098]|uniref:DUF417 family protein n=1 Tax=Chryseobacterium sp. SG20098 TaxID=3074145 RepID=UPI002883369F|nr:DUF417 family protein [Chryseobacterium sp. SG20098]WNI38071.1 DUF417 family protein [Chryseobacterium sp. SG20098]
MKNYRLYHRLLQWDAYFFNFLRIAIFIVMAWIGGLKAFHYEADGIVPFVANSPLMSFFYKNADHKVIKEDKKRVAEYTLYKNPEGKVVQKNIDWHQENGTYAFSYGLGTMIVVIGVMVLLGIWFPKIGTIGGALTFLMSLVTLSFLVTTPEVYVPNLGGDYATPQYGFPYLSGAGRLVLKDIIMMAGGLVLFSDSLKKLVRPLDQ